jgi:hypothetical protein
MYLLVLFLPFLGFISPILFGRYLGRGAFFISTVSIGMTLLVTLILFYEVVYNFSIVYVDLGYWLNLTHIQIGWSFIFDSITVSMLFIISLISFLVHFYSIYYMNNDKHYPRFMAYLSLFTFFMILLVTSNNLLLLFFGWEGDLKRLIWYNYNDSFIFYNFFILSNPIGLIKINGNQRIGPHNFDIISLIIGSLLGDSHIEKRNKGFRLIFEQSNNNVEYLMWFHKFFAIRGYCNPIPPKLHKRIKKDNKVFFHYRIKTYTFNSFYWIHEMFYKWDSNKYIKIIPSNLSEYFTPMVLAIWFMDDGSKIGDSVRIATNGFGRSRYSARDSTLEEIQNLCNILLSKYNIIATPQKAGKNKGYILYIHKKSKETFINIVKPYMMKSLMYKLGENESL